MADDRWDPAQLPEAHEGRRVGDARGMEGDRVLGREAGSRSASASIQRRFSVSTSAVATGS